MLARLSFTRAGVAAAVGAEFDLVPVLFPFLLPEKGLAAGGAGFFRQGRFTLGLVFRHCGYPKMTLSH